MLKLFEDLSGYYLPSFFYIYTEDSIDFQNFESNTAEIKGTFIHEYCHYIQDVSTTYGYTNAIYVLQELIKKTSREDKALEDILKSNRRCYSLCNGDKDVDATIWYINSIKIQTDEDFEYVLIQYNGRDEFPYNVCEKICKYEYQEFSKNKMWIMALCELALLEMAGGVFFVKALRLMKEKQFIPCNVQDIEKFINNNFSIGFRAKRDTIEMLLENLYPNAVTDFYPIKIWILSRFEIGNIFREKCKCFISAALSREDLGVRFALWQQIMNQFGAPNVVTGNGELVHGAYWKGNQIDLEYILAPMAINQLLDHTGTYKKDTCPLHKICCHSTEESYYSEICKSDPRMKIKETSLCPIGFFWKIYDIENNKKEET